MRAGIEDVRPWRDGEDPLQHFRDLAEDWKLRSSMIAVDDDLQAKALLEMQAVLPAALFRPGHAILAKIMRVKDKEELDLLQKAADIADEAFEAFLPRIRAGMTEVDLERIILEEMQRRGGKPTFCIVATGPNSAEPHHVSDETVIEQGHVLILDFGCSYGGYQSDITRTVCVGQATDEAKQVYDVVYASHMAGRGAIRPGTACQSVDQAARRVIDDAGYGEYFVHRTGHGIGMKGHEEPYIIEGNKLPLEPGHCFSVEPGIYLPGRFGVRVENIVTVTADGYRSFNAEPSPHLLVVG
jgi:Xaa-Pro aminopeptidase